MSEFLKDFSDFITESDINVYRIAVMHGDGQAEAIELKPCNPCQNAYSVSKFFTLTALGLLWDEGKLDTKQSVAELLAPYCPEDMHPTWHKVTVDAAIRHRCGLPAGYLDIDCNSTYDYGRDFLAYVLRTPVEEDPEYAYSDGDFYLLARIATALAGKPLTEYLWEKLFFDLGFQEVAWSCCPLGYAMGATGLYLRTEDMVKLGALYLNHGVFGGKRLLSEEWVNKVVEEGYLPRYFHQCYGHGGMCGQMLLVMPDKDLAVAWQGFHHRSDEVKKWLDNYFYN